MQLFHIIFTEPRAHHLVCPCTDDSDQRGDHAYCMVALDRDDGRFFMAGGNGYRGRKAYIYRGYHWEEVKEMPRHRSCKLTDIQGSAKRWSPGCVNTAGKARQKWLARAETKFTKPGARLLA